MNTDTRSQTAPRPRGRDDVKPDPVDQDPVAPEVPDPGIVEPDTFEPKAIAFVCNWCTYTAADLAGTSRLTYPDNVRLVRVMCTGMVDTQYVIKAFLEGADAVLVSGCHPGDCHYINGNYKARRRIMLLRQILPRFGIEAARLRLTWIGASDGIAFAQTMNRFVAQIKDLGPCQARMHAVI
ncbi:MAG: hydrogenase iron-sulfur subunit [Desulfotignum sp.]|nr:hydrogenase iron-sulfur subunit [Desulfotignum sp.]